jgi:ribosome-binding factor A
MGEEKDYLRTQAGLDSAKGFIKKEVGSRMDLKYMPDITFKHDPSLEKGDRMEKILEGLKPDESKDASE